MKSDKRQEDQVSEANKENKRNREDKGMMKQGKHNKSHKDASNPPPPKTSNNDRMKHFQNNEEDKKKVQKPWQKQNIGPYYTSVMQDNKGATLEDFELLKVVGQGSFGKVCQVKHKKSKQMFAMKILRKDNIFKKGQQEHTKTERRVLERIDHPFIVSLRYAFQTPDKLYLVLDYFVGGELFYHLKMLEVSMKIEQGFMEQKLYQIWNIYTPQTQFTEIQNQKMFFQMKKVIQYLQILDLQKKELNFQMSLKHFVELQIIQLQKL